MPQGPTFANDALFRNYLKYVQHFVIHEIANDNDSLYSALAYLLLDKQVLPILIREVVAIQLEDNPEVYEDFIWRDLDDIVEDVRNGVRGGTVELAAAACAYQYNIVIYHCDGFTPVLPSNAPFPDTISISLHDDGHYNALVPYQIPAEVCKCQEKDFPKYDDNNFGMVKVINSDPKISRKSYFYNFNMLTSF